MARGRKIMAMQSHDHGTRPVGEKVALGDHALTTEEVGKIKFRGWAAITELLIFWVYILIFGMIPFWGVPSSRPHNAAAAFMIPTVIAGVASIIVYGIFLRLVRIRRPDTHIVACEVNNRFNRAIPGIFLILLVPIAAQWVPAWWSWVGFAIAMTAFLALATWVAVWARMWILENDAIQRRVGLLRSHPVECDDWQTFDTFHSLEDVVVVWSTLAPPANAQLSWLLYERAK